MMIIIIFIFLHIITYSILYYCHTHFYIFIYNLENINLSRLLFTDCTLFEELEVLEYYC